MKLIDSIYKPIVEWGIRDTDSRRDFFHRFTVRTSVRPVRNADRRWLRDPHQFFDLARGFLQRIQFVQRHFECSTKLWTMQGKARAKSPLRIGYRHRTATMPSINSSSSVEYPLVRILETSASSSSARTIDRAVCTVSSMFLKMRSNTVGAR